MYHAGLHTSAFFFGHAAMHMIDILVQPAIFMSLYYTLTLPEIKFIDYYFGGFINCYSVKYCSICRLHGVGFALYTLSLLEIRLTAYLVWLIDSYATDWCGLASGQALHPCDSLCLESIDYLLGTSYSSSHCIVAFLV